MKIKNIERRLTVGRGGAVGGIPLIFNDLQTCAKKVYFLFVFIDLQAITMIFFFNTLFFNILQMLIFPSFAYSFIILQPKVKPIKYTIMENTTKMERLSAAAEKAEKTLNRAANWEANRNNAAGHLMAINAARTIIEGNAAADDIDAAAAYLRGLFMAEFNAQAKARVHFEAAFSAIKAAATPIVLAYAVNARGLNFDAAVRGCYSDISAANKAEKAEKWQNTLRERAEKANVRAEKSAAFADKATRAAAVKAAKARQAAEKAAKARQAAEKAAAEKAV